jgi:hypothetical protein
MTNQKFNSQPLVDSSIKRTIRFYLIVQNSHRQVLEHFVGVNEMVSSTFELEKGE